MSGLPGLSLVLKNTINAVNKGVYTKESLQDDYEYTVQRLNDLLIQERQKLQKQEVCEHTYTTGIFTLRRNVLGNYRKVHQRKCSKCSKVEEFTEYEDTESKPKWTEQTKEVYYNNFI